MNQTKYLGFPNEFQIQYKLDYELGNTIPKLDLSINFVHNQLRISVMTSFGSAFGFAYARNQNSLVSFLDGQEGTPQWICFLCL